MKRSRFIKLAGLAFAMLAPAALGQPARVVAILDEERVELSDGTRRWFKPEAVKQVLLIPPSDADTPQMFFRIAEMEWEPSLPPINGEIRMVLPATALQRWKEKGTLEIVYRIAQYPAVTAGKLYAIPERLEPESFETDITVHQRSSKTMPGSRGFLTLSLDDIAGAGVLVTLKDANKAVVHDAVPMREGDGLRLTLSSETGVLVLDKLVNRAFDNDFAVFRIVKQSEWESYCIHRLLHLIEHGNVTFIREGKEYNGDDAAAHLRKKLTRGGEKIRTLDDFILNIASKSSTTGRPYRIKRTDGAIVNAEEWLREQGTFQLLPK